MIAFPLRRIIIIGVIAGCLCSSAFAAEPLPPESTTPWKVDNSPFTGKSEKAFSGLACAHTGICVLAVDEGRRGGVMRIQGERLVFVGEPFKFRGVKRELDAETVAVDGAYFYVSGSHAMKRDTACDNPDSRNVYRLSVDDSGHVQSRMAPRMRLWETLRSLPKLTPYVRLGDCRSDSDPCRDHVDIEGLAAANGRLFFALRAPNVEGNAYVVAVDAEALFEGGDLRPSVAEIFLGANRGFRDLTIADGEALALVGPCRKSSGDFSIVQLRGLTTGASVRPIVLGTLDLTGVPASKSGKPMRPEAITPLDANADRYRLLVLSDGGKNGAPLVFNVPRKP